MAETIKRTFWIIPGEVGKDGQPVEHAEKPSVGVLGTGLGLGVRQPVQVVEEMTPDGEYHQFATDPQTGERTEVGQGVDKARLDLYKARQAQATPKKTPEDVARTEAETREAEARTALLGAQTTAAQQAKKTPEDVAQTQAQTDEARARAAQLRAQTAGLNPTVTRPTGGYDRSEGQTAPRTETVSQAQAKYDLDAAQMANTAAQQARENIIAQARLSVEQGHLSATQAHNQAIEQIQRLQLQLDEQRNQLTQRGQDITAGVTQRGQDLGYAQGLAQAGTSFAGRLMQDWVPEGQAASFNNLLTSMGGKAIPTAPLPWGPDLPLQLARQAQTQAPAGFQLPPGPFKTPAAP